MIKVIINYSNRGLLLNSSCGSCVTSSTWSQPKLPPGTIVWLRQAQCVSFCPLSVTRMAACKDDADIDDMFANEEELREAFCVLAGSDSTNCSYSQVRKASCTVSPQPSQSSLYMCRSIVCLLLWPCYKQANCFCVNMLLWFPPRGPLRSGTMGKLQTFCFLWLIIALFPILQRIMKIL